MPGVDQTNTGKLSKLMNNTLCHIVPAIPQEVKFGRAAMAYEETVARCLGRNWRDLIPTRYRHEQQGEVSYNERGVTVNQPVNTVYIDLDWLEEKTGCSMQNRPVSARFVGFTPAAGSGKNNKTR